VQQVGQRTCSTRLEDTLATLGINDKEPSLTSSELQATLAHLLTSRSGIYHAIDSEPATVAAQRPTRGRHAPGEFWSYNNWDFDAAGSIYKKIAGSDIFTAFKRRIADRIGMGAGMTNKSCLRAGCATASNR
jgi:CubicO group peptidase (beta-lactamase class C family)